MMGLLVLKERLKEFYGKYDIYINPVFRFLFGLSAMLILNSNLGFMAKLTGPVPVLVTGLVCSFLPYSIISLLITVIMLLHLYSASLEIALIVGVLVFIIILLYSGLQPGDSFLLVLTPMMFFLNIPYVLPILVGLAGSLTAVIPVSLGILMYYILLYIKQNVGALTGTVAAVDITQKYVQLIKSMLSNRSYCPAGGNFYGGYDVFHNSTDGRYGGRHGSVGCDCLGVYLFCFCGGLYPHRVSSV